MRDELAELVFPVLAHALQVKDRLARGEALLIEREQAILRGLLRTEAESRRWLDFGGEESHHAGEEPFEAAPAQRAPRLLGVRYALVCWLDELFTLDSPWSSDWNERKLEAELYGTNDRAWRFWEQAKLAETLPGDDVLEAFYLCVMLGFRGDRHDRPDELRAWAGAARTRLAAVREPDWPYSLDFEPRTQVPPRTGRDRLQRLVIGAAAVLLLALPVLVFLLLQRLG